MLLQEMLVPMIKEEQNTIADFMSNGSCSDWAAYRFAVGEIEGMNRVLDMLQLALIKLNEEEYDA